MHTTQTFTINTIDRDWKKLSTSRKTNNELQSMIADSDYLAAYTSRDIISIVSAGKDTSRHERDPVLTGLFSFVNERELASRLILQSLIPQIIYLIKNTNFADPEERASAITSIAIQRVMSWRPQTDQFCHLSLYNFIYKNTMNMARKWKRWNDCVFESDLTEPELTPIEFLIDWVSDLGNTDRQTAEMVVLTRCGFSSIDHFSQIIGLNPQTLRQRRLRTENLVRQKITQENAIAYPS